MFVTASNFDTPPYNIPNLNQVVNTFLDYVAMLEEEALVELLGRQLYKTFIDAWAAMPDEYSSAEEYSTNDQVRSGNNIWKSLVDNNEGNELEEGANWTLEEEDNKWLELVNGAEYTYASKVWKWGGIVKLLTPFIYSRYVTDNVDSFSGNGVVVPQNENSAIISPSLRITRAYNTYAALAGVRRGRSFFDEMYARGRSYHYADCFNYEDTLYGFLTANGEEVYPDWCFKSPDLMNIAGI